MATSVPKAAISPLSATMRFLPNLSASQPLGSAESRMNTPTNSIKKAAGPAAFSRS